MGSVQETVRGVVFDVGIEHQVRRGQSVHSSSELYSFFSLLPCNLFSADDEGEFEGWTETKVCADCSYMNDTPYCNKCHKIILRCSICHLSLLGQSVFCLFCGHGGHPEHMARWFQESEVCSVAGCGCRCDIKLAVESG